MSKKVMIIIVIILMIASAIFIGTLRANKEDKNALYEQAVNYTQTYLQTSISTVITQTEAEAEKTSDTPDGNYTLFGRWYKAEVNGKTCDNSTTSGSMIFFKIGGTDSVTIEFEDRSTQGTPYFAYSIDDGSFKRQSITDDKIKLPDKSDHRVCVMMDGMSEQENKWSGEIGYAFSNIDTNGGEISSYLPNKKKIIFIGDSITEGVMSIGPDSNNDNNSASNSYVYHTAKELKALPYFIGYGATGITTTGSFNTTDVTFDYLSESKKISSSDYPDCDLIVLFAGTNDYSAPDDVFEKGYEDFVKKLHKIYPNKFIVSIIPFTQTHADQLRTIGGKYDYVKIVETSGWTIDYSDGAQIHPSTKGSKQIASKLAEFIRQNNLL